LNGLKADLPAELLALQKQSTHRPHQPPWTTSKWMTSNCETSEFGGANTLLTAGQTHGGCCHVNLCTTCYLVTESTDIFMHNLCTAHCCWVADACTDQSPVQSSSSYCRAASTATAVAVAAAAPAAASTLPWYSPNRLLVPEQHHVSIVLHTQPEVVPQRRQAPRAHKVMPTRQRGRGGGRNRGGIGRRCWRLLYWQYIGFKTADDVAGGCVATDDECPCLKRRVDDAC
jgi:hypothetical protein